MNIDSQFKKDTEILDKFFTMYAGVYVKDGFVKEAQVLDGNIADQVINYFKSSLGGIFSSIKREIESIVDKQGVFSLLTLFQFAFLRMSSPLYWIALASSWVFGLDAGTIAKTIAEKAKEVIIPMAKSNNGNFLGLT